MNDLILFTSFDTWLSHHQTNSSDDLIALASQHPGFPKKSIWLRKLVVDFAWASAQVIPTIETFSPSLIICCGMAEKATKLTLETCATSNQENLSNNLPLENLAQSLANTEISQDAGKFVCEALYYAVLKHCQQPNYATKCLFIHVPVLTEINTPYILQDFLIILQRLPNLPA